MDSTFVSGVKQHVNGELEEIAAGQDEGDFDADALLYSTNELLHRLPSDCSPLLRSIVSGMLCERTSAHVAPTGSGKSHQSRVAAAFLYREGMRVLLAYPTKVLCDEAVEHFRRNLSDAFDAGEIAEVYGRNAKNDYGQEIAGSFPISENTRIIICTHAQLTRRGWSRYLRGLMSFISRKPSDDNFTPYHIIIDEYSEFIKACRHSIALEHRCAERQQPDGTLIMQIPLRECPKHARSGNCGNCELRRYGGSQRYNEYSFRELGRPEVIRFNKHRLQRNWPNDPLTIAIGGDGLMVEENIRVGRTTSARRVTGIGDMEIDPDSLWAYRIEYFTADDDGKHPEESNHEIITDLLRFSHNPVIATEHPIDSATGQIVRSEALKDRIERAEEDWDENISFPYGVCDASTLLLTDICPLENLRRYSEHHWTGIALLDGSPLHDDQEVLRAVFPQLQELKHPYPDRKVKQVAIVTPSGHRSLHSLIGNDQRLLTVGLEDFGDVIIFAATKKDSGNLYNEVYKAHTTSCRVDGNDKHIDYASHIMADGIHRCFIGYTRSVLGRGVNRQGVAALVIDARAFRPLSSFNPGVISQQEFELARDRERVGLIIQNLGRVLRGEHDKLAVVVVLNADPELLTVLRSSEAILEGCEQPPIFAAGDDMTQIMDQCVRWMHAGGGDWPEPDPALATVKNEGGRPKKSLEALLKQAREASSNGVSWSDFYRKCNLGRLRDEDRGQLREFFK